MITLYRKMRKQGYFLHRWIPKLILPPPICAIRSLGQSWLAVPLMHTAYYGGKDNQTTQDFFLLSSLQAAWPPMGILKPTPFVAGGWGIGDAASEMLPDPLPGQLAPCPNCPWSNPTPSTILLSCGLSCGLSGSEAWLEKRPHQKPWRISMCNTDLEHVRQFHRQLRFQCYLVGLNVIYTLYKFVNNSFPRI